MKVTAPLALTLLVFVTNLEASMTQDFESVETMSELEPDTHPPAFVRQDDAARISSDTFALTVKS